MISFYLLLFFTISGFLKEYSPLNSNFGVTCYQIVRPEGLDNGYLFEDENITEIQPDLNSYNTWGISVVVQFQNWQDPTAVEFSQYLSWFGEEAGFLFIALELIQINKKDFHSIKEGLTIAAMISGGSMFVYTLKLAFAFPRPYWMSSEIFVFECYGSSFSFPSEFIVAPTVTFMWISLMNSNYGRNWAVQFLVWFLISLYDAFLFSIRLFLGATHPIDIIGAYVLGFLIVFVFKVLFIPIFTWGAEKPFQKESIKFFVNFLCASFLTVVAIGWVLATFYIGKIGRDINSFWEQLHDTVCPTIFQPDRFQDACFWTGAWSGTLFSVLFVYKYCEFIPQSGSYLQKVGRLFLGTLGGGFWALLPVIDQYLTSEAGAVILYFLIGFITLFWALFLSPLIGYQIRLIPYLENGNEDDSKRKQRAFELF